MASYNGNESTNIFGTADTISESEDAEFLSASEAVKKLEEVNSLNSNYSATQFAYSDDRAG